MFTPKIDYDTIKISSQNRDEDDLIAPQFIVSHCIGLPFLDVIEGLSSPVKEGTKGLGVSSHYFIPQLTGKELQNKGWIPQDIKLLYPHHIPAIQFVPESHRAWHAGPSQWGDRQNLNDCSIGIEFHAPEYGANDDWFHFTPYTTAQMKTGISLMANIVARWKMNPHHILAHSDIAPYRLTRPPKTDPGPLFPWRMLASQGLGYLPSMPSKMVPINDHEEWVRKRLSRIGYAIPTTSDTWGEHEKHVVNAYRMHFIPNPLHLIHPNDPKFGIVDDELIQSLQGFDVNAMRLKD